MIISGNVQISGEHLSLGRDILMPTDVSPLDDENTLKPWRELAAAMHNDSDGKTLALLQLSHAGRQSPNIIGGRKPFAPPLAPSGVPVGASSRNGMISNALHTFLFQRPRAMETKDVDDVIHSFTNSAHLAFKAGFDGVQLHAAHGCMCV
jgi:2,4-dienoyl-CoA reductase-like NADH-dependent reductase (Old Yellow Enzyme family)